MINQEIAWVDPLLLAQHAEGDMVLLYSSSSPQISILALDKKEEIIADNIDQLNGKLSDDKNKFDNAWFGYLGYGLKNSIEKLSTDQASHINMPDLWMMQFRLLLIFDHKNKKITVQAEDKTALNKLPHVRKQLKRSLPSINSLKSNMSKQEYLAKVQAIKQAIINGDLSQANLTRKFYGDFDVQCHPIDIFAKLCSISPSDYSAFLRMGDYNILSSSPECFLRIDNQNNVISCPIKGTLQRDSDPIKDQLLYEQLASSTKDKAENLMIVDLMRNDFAKNCATGSVKVSKLYEIKSYATLHHMVSTVLGKKLSEISNGDFIKGCFPPGSMTGTPKIQAMELCSQLEQQARGVYAGALGWFGGDGSCDLSVVIRTIIIENNKFEFQVGGAIIYDSDPEQEWQETLTKAKAIANSMTIDLSILAAI